MIPLTPALFAACLEASARHGLPQELICGIVRVESSSVAGCHRLEPHYRWFWDNAKNAPFRKVEKFELERLLAPSGFSAPKGIASTADTEWNAQRQSWGPMQIMGATAREIGYLGWLPDLCGESGIRWGALYLKHLASRHFERHGWRGVASAYNDGTPNPDDNAEYLEKLVHAGVDFDALKGFYK